GYEWVMGGGGLRGGWVNEGGKMEASRLRLMGRRLRRRPTPRRDHEADTVREGGGSKRMWPLPRGNRDMNRAVDPRQANVLVPEPAQGADVAVADCVCRDDRAGCGFQRRPVERAGDADVRRRRDQSLGMRRKLEHAPTIDPLSLEDGTAIVERMAQDMNLHLAPGCQ